ncbi:MAG: bacterio-opsin activator domain-containing protein [Haloglomus sp.]
MEPDVELSGAVGETAAAATDSVQPVVLIVDDERDLADTYARWLDDVYDVRTAYGGDEAIETVDEEVDVVLLDRRMPRVTGDEVLEHIRDEGLDCRVSMLTAVEPTSNLTDLGFDEYLVKPVTKTDLVEVVNELLLRGSLTEETQAYLALQSTADTLSDYAEEADIDPETIAELREEVEAAGDDPTVQEESAELERLQKLNGLVRSVNRAVVDVGSRDELERRICEQFVDVEPYTHAVAGEYAPAYDRFIPTATAAGDVDADPVSCDGEGVLHEALTAGKVRVADVDALDETVRAAFGELLEVDPSSGSVIVLPVTYGETVHGGVVLWADESLDLSERERTVLAELGTTVGNALDSLQTKAIVHADRVVAVELEVSDRRDIFVDLSAELGCRVRLEGLNVCSGAGVVCYLTVATQRADAVVEFLAASDAVDNCRAVDDRGDDVLVECAVRDDSLLLESLEANGNVTEFFVDEGRGQVGLEVPPSRNLRSVFEELRDPFEDIDLVSKRTTDRDYQSIEGFRASLESELTDRQNAVIEAAYRAGYFDWPRESTAEEVAEGLGMAPPTFHEHLREAESKLAGIYLDEKELDGPDGSN